MSNHDLPQAMAALIRAQSDYAAAQASADVMLAEAQQRRETSMRRVGALGLSHRRIGELTGLSHTRVNQILGTGTTRPPQDIHFPPGFLPAPTTVALAALRVIGEEGPRAWRLKEIATELDARGWPSDDLKSVLVELVAEGVVLSVDGGYFTLHGYAYPGQSAPTPAAA
ncbi:MAG: hypothetical protein ACLP0J_17190 [Solirubrobacteraceae bacterium]